VILPLEIRGKRHQELFVVVAGVLTDVRLEWKIDHLAGAQTAFAVNELSIEVRIIGHQSYDTWRCLADDLNALC
jgi:hypothetical protein